MKQLALALALAAGCVRGMHVQATVTDQARPLAGARVSMDCPQVFKANGLSLLGTTDERGFVDHHEHRFGRWISKGCDLVVDKPGYEPRRFSVGRVCRTYDLNHCVEVDLAVELARYGTSL